MISQGLPDLLPFLRYLREQRVFFKLDFLRDAALMVTLNLVGERIEIEFFQDHIEYSIFSGDESVKSDEKLIFEMIAQHQNG